MKPKPFSALNHLTVPCAMAVLLLNNCLNNLRSVALAVDVGRRVRVGCRPVHASREKCAVLFAALTVLLRRWSGFAEDPVHSCSAGRAGALGHSAAVRLGGLTGEVALFLAFHAVPVVALRHWWCLSIRGWGRRSALTVLGDD